MIDKISGLYSVRNATIEFDPNSIGFWLISWSRPRRGEDMDQGMISISLAATQALARELKLYVIFDLARCKSNFMLFSSLGLLLGFWHDP